MPRTKPDKTVIHRHELGGKERELAESVVAAFSFNRISTPLVAGLSDVSFVLTVGALLSIWFPNIILPKAEDGLDAVLEAIKIGVEHGAETIGVDGPSRWEIVEQLFSLTPFGLPIQFAEEIV